MRIQSIRNNCYNTDSNKKISSPNFKSILSPSEAQRVLNMLKPAVTETIIGDNISILKMVFNSLSRKYLPRGVDSYGVMLIPCKNLLEFCKGIKIPTNKLSSMKGFCVSAGGKYSPMQIWTEVYETKLVLIPKNKICN